MHDGVAVIGCRQLPSGRYDVDRRRAFRETPQQAGLRERTQRLLQVLDAAQLQIVGLRQVPAVDQHGDVARLAPDLAGIKCAPVRCKQYQCNEICQRYRNGTLDTGADFECELLHMRAFRDVN